jgi:hypothetical protein
MNGMRDWRDELNDLRGKCFRALQMTESVDPIIDFENKGPIFME